MSRLLLPTELKVQKADVAQLAEQLICNQQVIGSSPIIGFYCKTVNNVRDYIVRTFSSVG